MAPFALNLVALLRQRQAVDLDHVVEHPREDLDHLAERLPVETCVLRERIDDESRQGARKKRQVIPARNLLKERESAHPITAQFRLNVDIVDHLRREHETAADNVGISFRCHDIFPLSNIETV